MEVYIEVTYFINAFILLLSFELLCFLLNIQMNKKELFVYCLTYNISFILLYIDFFDGFLFIYYLFLTYYYFRKQTYIYYPIFMFIYISILSFLQFILPSSVIFQGVLLIEQLQLSSLFIITIMFLIILYFYISFCEHQLQHNDLVHVSFDNISTMGFIDTGNQVFYKGYPVIFISSEMVEHYKIIDTILIRTAYSDEKIEIIQIDKIEINFQTLHNVYAGKMSLSEYDCILNKKLMGGLI